MSGMNFDQWFKQFNSWGLSHEELVNASLRTTGSNPGDVVYVSPSGSAMTRHMCSHWIDFYSAAHTGWFAREKPTSPVTSTRAGTEKAAASAWPAEQPLVERLRDELRALRNTLGVTGLGRRFIDNHPEIFGTNADSIASEKVCDHPSTEKAAAANHLSVLIEAVGHEGMQKVKSALSLAGYCIFKGDPDASLIANPANSLRSLPESSDPSLLGRETVRELPRWRHKKRGSTYAEIGRGKLQSFDPGGLVDMQELVIYRSDADGSLWARPQDEFEDGRFETLSPLKE